MQRETWMIALACAACGGEKKQAAPAGPKTYKLSVRADQEEPPGGVSVSITWPAGWTEKEVTPMGPRMQIAGAANMMEGTTLLVRLCPEGTEGAACIDKIIEKLHDPTKIEVAAVNDRKWLKGTLGKLVNGSLFAYHPASKTVVECQTFLQPENAAKLADARTACESMAF